MIKNLLLTVITAILLYDPCVAKTSFYKPVLSIPFAILINITGDLDADIVQNAIIIIL